MGLNNTVKVWPSLRNTVASHATCPAGSGSSSRIREPGPTAAAAAASDLLQCGGRGGRRSGGQPGRQTCRIAVGQTVEREDQRIVALVAWPDQHVDLLAHQRLELVEQLLGVLITVVVVGRSGSQHPGLWPEVELDRAEQELLRIVRVAGHQDAVEGLERLDLLAASGRGGHRIDRHTGDRHGPHLLGRVGTEQEPAESGGHRNGGERKHESEDPASRSHGSLLSVLTLGVRGQSSSPPCCRSQASSARSEAAPWNRTSSSAPPLTVSRPALPSSRSFPARP